MQAIKSHIIITSLRSRKDGSLGFSAETPELTSKEKVVWLELQGKNVTALFAPTDSPEAPVVEIDKDLEQKSQSTRIRNTLYVLWKQQTERKQEDRTYEEFYKDKTERYIDNIKSLLD